MRTSILRTGVASCLCLAAVSASYAADAAGPSVDPRIDRAIRSGLAGPMQAPGHRGKAGTAPVIIELRQNADASTLERLRLAGARLYEGENGALAYKSFVPARVDAAAAGKLAAMASIKRVSLAPAPSPRPLDNSASLLQLEAARGARPALDLLTGKGTLVADLDSNADVFHPQFFFADAGYYDWIDVNDNGSFEPSVDAIDLDRDGKAGPKETARLLRAETLYLAYGKPAGARADGFDPGIDWLFLDDNGNGARDFGKAAGFDDSVPAMGEPLFVPDDLNRNGKLDPGERAARLGTSKFKKVYVHIEYYADVDHVFERGKDLASHENEYTGGASGYSDALHGSGVLSIVAGDVPLAGRRWVGMAPDAEVVLGYEVSQGEGTAVAWALNQSPDIVLHETASWTGVPMDGSDAYSAMVDTSVVEDLVTHTCPMGNLGGSAKHARLGVAKGVTTSATFEVPTFGAYYVNLSLNVRGASGVKAVLKEPGGKAYDLPAAAPTGFLTTGAYLLVSRETSSRGTGFTEALLYTLPENTATKPVPTGTWTLELTGDPASDATVDAYLMDDVSGWSKGVAWSDEVATDQGTVGVPAVSDHCIAVGALTGHPGGESEPWFGATAGQPGVVRDYSGRGPRIDGVQKPDVIAPDNPWAAAPWGKGLQGANIPHGAVWPFSGTSGATPHVTGITALMAQAGIRGDAAREAIRQGAVADAVTGPVPNQDYGYGRMSAAAALGVSKTGGEPPVAALTASLASAYVGDQVVLAPSASDPDSSELEVKWDDGYDGVWDTSYGPVQERKVKLESKGTAVYKVRVRDEGGRFAEAIVRIDVGDKPIVEPSPEGGIDAGNESGSDAGIEAGTDSGKPAVTTGADSDDGCGCRTPGRSSQTGVYQALAVLALLLVGVRRRASISDGSRPNRG